MYNTTVKEGYLKTAERDFKVKCLISSSYGFIDYVTVVGLFHLIIKKLKMANVIKIFY